MNAFLLAEPPTSPSAFLGVERSVLGRRWRVRAADDRQALALAQRLGVPEIVGRLLAARGIGIDEAPAFLAPRLREALPDPSRFRDMDRAAERLARAIMAGEPVAVFGDYDVDGATSAALLHRFFAAAGAALRIYVPDRLREGYGPNLPALLALKAEGTRVVVTVDCGTLAFGVLEDAAAAGLDVVVADHHTAEPRLPAGIVVNPNRLDEARGFGQLAAVGVAFLLVVALNRALRQAGWYGAARAEPDLFQWLDLVALGTVCDVVPLTGVNRALVAQGLKVLASRANPGIAALCEVAGLSERPDAYHLGFILGPRVNAGGRVGAADVGARLLSTDDPVEAAALARQLDAWNEERRVIENSVLDAALAQVDQGPREAPLVFAAGEGWHPGVIGIVAARLVQRYARPALVTAIVDGLGRGSGRSCPGVDLGGAIVAALQAGLLVNGGGHPMAAGFTVAADRVAEFRAFMAARVAAAAGTTRLEPVLEIDGALQVGGATFALAEAIERVGPFGSGNPRARFVLAGARVVSADPVGTNHVRCVLTDAGGNARLAAMAFRCADTPVGEILLRRGALPLHLAGQLTCDRWNGQQRARFEIEDAAPAA
jgi:single-stranded-DNA-specific exonuclease